MREKHSARDAWRVKFRYNFVWDQLQFLFYMSNVKYAACFKTLPGHAFPPANGRRQAPWPIKTRHYLRVALLDTSAVLEAKSFLKVLFIFQKWKLWSRFLDAIFVAWAATYTAYVIWKAKYSFQKKNLNKLGKKVHYLHLQRKGKGSKTGRHR